MVDANMEQRQSELNDVNLTSNTRHPIEITVADQHGVDIGQLIAAIEYGYRSVHGNPVKIEIGRGVYVNGVPQGTILLKDRKDVRAP